MAKLKPAVSSAARSIATDAVKSQLREEQAAADAMNIKAKPPTPAEIKTLVDETAKRLQAKLKKDAADGPWPDIVFQNVAGAVVADLRNPKTGGDAPKASKAVEKAMRDVQRAQIDTSAYAGKLGWDAE